METYTTFNSTTTHSNEITWCCSLGDKNMNLKNKTGHINFNFLKRRERFDFTVEKFEFYNPEKKSIRYYT